MGVRLGAVDLSGRALAGAVLVRVDLSGARLAEADLDRATLCDAVWTTRGSASMRAKTRSLAESPCWNWLQKEAMLVRGNQKRETLCRKRYQSPAETSPAMTERPPA